VIAALAQASLLRHRARTALAVLGVAVAAAMLLDMVMLATGMRESFRELLLSRGFEIRLAPKTSRTIIKMIISSGTPRFMICSFLEVLPQKRPDGAGC